MTNGESAYLEALFSVTLGGHSESFGIILCPYRGEAEPSPLKGGASLTYQTRLERAGKTLKTVSNA